MIAFPTETFYALGVHPFDAAAIARLYELKGRSPTRSPILVLVRDRDDLARLVADITPAAESLMAACWPGPLTLVFRASGSVPPLLTAGSGTVGVRLSASSHVRQLLGAVKGPLTGTSANKTGQAPATTAEAVEQVLGGGVDLIIDGGPTPGGLPSTVLDTTVTPLRIVRQGRVSKALLQSLASAEVA